MNQLIKLLNTTGISKTDMLVFQHIQQSANKRGYAKNMKSKNIAEGIGKSLLTVQQSVKKLVEHGFMKKRYVLERGTKKKLVRTWEDVQTMQVKKHFALTGTTYFIVDSNMKKQEP